MDKVRSFSAKITGSGASEQLELKVVTPDISTDNEALVHVYDLHGHVNDFPLQWKNQLANKDDVFEGTIPVATLKQQNFDLATAHAMPRVRWNQKKEESWGDQFKVNLASLAAAPTTWAPIPPSGGQAGVPGPTGSSSATAAGAGSSASQWFNDKDEEWLSALAKPATVDPKALALDEVGRADEGALFLVGGQVAMNQAARVTAIRHPQLGRGTEVMLQLLPGVSSALDQSLTAQGVQKATAVIDDAGYDGEARVSLVGNANALVVPDYSGNTPTTAFRFEKPGAYVLEFLGEKGVPKAYRGAVRLRAYGANEQERRTNIKEAAARVGLGALLEAPDAGFSRKIAAQSLMRHVNPQAADELAGKLESLTPEEVEAKAKALGITDERLQAAGLKEVFPGHAAMVDPHLGADYVKAGVKGVFTGVRDFESVVRILSSDGLMAYTERTGRGLFRPGSSNRADELSGGARTAFTRAVTPRALAGSSMIQNSYAAGKVQLVTTGPAMRRLLSRTDWYGYPSDSFGAAIRSDEAQADPSVAQHSRSEAYSKRLAGKALVEAIDGGPQRPQYLQFQTSNELCFDSGVGNVWTHAVVQDEWAKGALVNALKQAGFKDFNGRSFDEAIVVAMTWRGVADALVKQGLTEWAQ